MSLTDPSNENPNPLDLDQAPTFMDQVFENKLVLKNIIEQVEDSTELKTNRLICSKWKEEATNVLKERNWMTRETIQFGDEMTFQNFLNTFEQSKENMMFSCFQMLPKNWDSDFKLYWSWMDKFLETFPNSIKSLELISMVLSSPAHFESILQSQAKSLTEFIIYSKPKAGLAVLGVPMIFSPLDFQLSSLKCLTTGSDIVMTEVFGEKDNLHRLNILEAVLSRIPPANKNTFRLSIDDCHQVDKTVELLEKYQMVKSLKSLQIILASKGEFEVLAEAGIEVESLIINLFFTATYMDAIRNDNFERDLLLHGIYEYLCYQSDTLNELSWGSHAFKFPLSMPRLKTLKLGVKHPADYPLYIEEPETEDENENLVLNHAQDQDMEVQDRPILYSETFPNLKELKLKSVKFLRLRQNPLDFESMFLTPQMPCTTLRKLHVSYDEINAQLLAPISTIFPKIKSLYIDHHEILQGEKQRDFYLALWNAEFASTIEELCIQFHILRERSWRPFELCSLLLGIEEEEIVHGFLQGPGNSSIYNYTNLKKVGLGTNDRYNGSGKLEEEFALTIFGKMEKLEHLYLDKEICELEFSDVHELKEQLKKNSTTAKPSANLKRLITNVRK